MTARKIVVAVDSSDEAHQVVRAATEIGSGGDITLVNVIQPITYACGPEPAGLGTTYFEIEQELAKAAGAKLDALAEEHGIAAKTVTTTGQPAHEIRKQAEDMGADLIVIGSHGRHGLGRLLGSTANSVLNGAPCSVFVVRIKQD